jgi:hypothetical protein
MTDPNDEIKIIGPPPAVVADAAAGPLAREGEPESGEEHSLWRPFKSKPVQEIGAQLAKVKEQVGVIVEGLSKSMSDKVELKEITVGLALTIEGDIGIASAGVEASIELTYDVK